MIYMAVGVVALAYAVYARELISWLTLVLLLVGGVLLILKGLAAR
jgi:hypothetical protein